MGGFSMKKAFYLFANSVFKKDWREAYKYLREYLSLNEIEDKNSLLYAILLEEILKFESYDFSFIDNLFFAKDNSDVNYNLAYEQILTHKYELALKSFNKYCLAEKKLHRNNDLSTIIIEVLLEEVTSIEFKIKEKEQKIAIKKSEEAKLKSKILNFKF